MTSHIVIHLEIALTRAHLTYKSIVAQVTMKFFFFLWFLLKLFTVNYKVPGSEIALTRAHLTVIAQVRLTIKFFHGSFAFNGHTFLSFAHA